MALPGRKELNSKWCWDLSTIFPSEKEALSAAGDLVQMADRIRDSYAGKICGREIAAQCISQYEAYRILSCRLISYGEFLVSTDFTDTDALSISNRLQAIYSDCQAKLAFVELELGDLPEETLGAITENNPQYAGFIRRILRDKKHRLQPETETLIQKMRPLEDLPYNIYNAQKLADLTFPDFEVDGTRYPLDYSLFEDCYEYHENTDIRRAASTAFYGQLQKCRNVTATAYNGLVTMETAIAKTRGFDSVFAYLLSRQEISEEIYNNHLDIMMKKLAPIMRRYAGLLQKAHGLDRMTYADLKLPFPTKEKAAVSLEEGRDYILQALSVMGGEYTDVADKIYRERRIDAVRNSGKSTGAFCDSVYGCGPYILCTWQNQISDLFTVAHEIGHAVHFELMQGIRSIFDFDLSLYLIEAPSTFNELLLADWLKNERGADGRDVAAMLIGNTFYHNFVTHFLEAYYQREVYRKAERGESMNADNLSAIYRSVLEQFWGDAVTLTDGCELTWMRQPHYYSGLYPYTYSASLSVAVSVWKNMKKNPQETIQKWKSFLRTGLTKSPAEAVETLGIHLSTGEHVLSAIEMVGELVDAL